MFFCHCSCDSVIMFLDSVMQQFMQSLYVFLVIYYVDFSQIFPFGGPTKYSLFCYFICVVCTISMRCNNDSIIMFLVLCNSSYRVCMGF